jgi:ABC-type branched-subunit amino acid transport system ATPase component
VATAKTTRSPRARSIRAPRSRAVAARSTAPPILEVSGVSVTFGGVNALSEVSMDVRENEIVGLIGPNGAGKTTLFECISGFQPFNPGRITYQGTDLSSVPPEKRAWIGIGRTLQNVRLFSYLTVLDNVRIALHRHMRRSAAEHAFRLPPAVEEERSILGRAEEVVQLFGMDAYADKYASELSYGTLRLLELACMIALDPKLLLLDEPSSGISQKETEALAPLLKRIQKQTGSTILMIEHDMPLIMGLADHLYVLDAGRVICEGTPDVVQRDPEVIEAYLGTPTERKQVSRSAAAARKTASKAAPLIEVKGLDVFYERVQVLYDVDFVVRTGERVALLGTNGAGKSTILKTVSGLVDPRAGKVFWKGDDITDMKAEDRVKLGIGHVPGGRGLFPTLSVGENLRMGGYLYTSDDEIEREAERVMAYFPWIKERQTQLAGTLSGGEQQQLATARALMLRPELLMIDELSLGLAPVIIERLMESLVKLHEDEGLTIVIVEQQASFALGYTDRAYFLEKGEVRFEGVSGDLLKREDLLRSVFLAGAAKSL